MFVLFGSSVIKYVFKKQKTKNRGKTSYCHDFYTFWLNIEFYMNCNAFLIFTAFNSLVNACYYTFGISESRTVFNIAGVALFGICKNLLYKTFAYIKFSVGTNPLTKYCVAYCFVIIRANHCINIVRHITTSFRNAGSNILGKLLFLRTAAQQDYAFQYIFSVHQKHSYILCRYTYYFLPFTI